MNFLPLELNKNRCKQPTSSRLWTTLPINFVSANVLLIYALSSLKYVRWIKTSCSTMKKRTAVWMKYIQCTHVGFTFLANQINITHITGYVIHVMITSFDRRVSWLLAAFIRKHPRFHTDKTSFFRIHFIIWWYFTSESVHFRML